MVKKIDVWRPKLSIPKLLRQKVDRISKTQKDRDYDVHGMMLYETTAGGESVYLDVLVCDRPVKYHKDETYPQFSLILTLANECKFFVKSYGQPIVKPQPAGTLVLLDLWKNHGLGKSAECKNKAGIWVGAIWDFDEYKSRKECESIVREALKEWQGNSDG